MSKCPFWSYGDFYQECYLECPMKQGLGKFEECIFQEILALDNLEFLDEGNNDREIFL